MEVALPIIAALLATAGIYAIVRRSTPAGTVFLAVAALVLAAGVTSALVP